MLQFTIKLKKTLFQAHFGALTSKTSKQEFGQDNFIQFSVFKLL